MENSYSYNSYPDSGGSSPRSREIDFENPPPWEDQQNPNYKVKFMCSYGGKILPRPHDNQLTYTGGETKILAVERTIKFSVLVARLSALSDSDVSFKYQLPGEDLDALISVTNDDDLEHMMHEYDRLYRASARPARMRLFLFPLNHSDSFGSDRSSDRDRFVEALNSGPIPAPDPISKPPVVVQNNVDFIPGWGKAGVVVTPPPPPAQPTVPELVAPPPEFQVRSGLGGDRVIGSDPVVNPVEFQRQLQDLQRLQIGDQPDQQYRRKSDDNLIGAGGGGGYGAAAGDYYMQKVPEKLPPVTMSQQISPPAGYWPEKHVAGGGFPGTVTGAPEQQQPMYMISAGGGGVYHAPPMVRPVTAPTNQGYYHMQQQPPQQQQQQQRMASDVYRDQPVYSAMPQPQQQQQTSSLPPQPPKYVATYAETAPYTQVAYDSATGRQVYYTAQGGGVVQPQQAYSAVGPAAVSGEMRVAGGLSPEGKVVGSKLPQTSV
ncbi:putative PB1 domain-containing protein [Rosa chinensis]|uniref:Putative PB1 domain-containing protein n=1 Tax=Rosa chinensis TaxID=74649 RepID=A0A2P6PQI7_ROSCH|nr:putative PB1 domain-containing protein [Rosa chinensis]